MNTDDIIKCVDKVTDAQVKPYLDELDAQGIKMTPNAAKLRAFSIKIYLAYKSLVDEFKYDAIAVSCWPKFQDDYRYSVCALDFTKTILSGGFEHHYPIAWGDYSDEIAEMNKW